MRAATDEGINVRLLRTPPHNEDAELALLSAILLDEAVFDTVAHILQPSDFYASSHSRVFAACGALVARGRPIDVQTVAGELRASGVLQHVGGVTFLARLLDGQPAIGNAHVYASMIAEQARLRRMIDTCQRAAAEGYTTTGGIAEWIDDVESRVFNIAHEGVAASSGPAQAFDLVRQVFADLADRNAGVGDSSVVPTGFTDHDVLLGGGLRDGELHIIAGRPGMGKTAYATEIALSVASTSRPEVKLGSLIISLEMPKEQLMNRLMCSEAEVSLQALRTNSLSEGQWQKLELAGNRISTLPLWIDDTPALTLLQLRAVARRMQREFERRDENGRRTQRLGVIVVDYLQLMRGSGRTDSREQEISEISRGLKAMAKDLKVPIVALSQLNRAVETRSTKDKRPQLSDLRESGAIEQDADAIHFIYRPHYYIADKNSEEALRIEGQADVIVAKQRNGATDTVKVRFIDQFAKFANRET